VGVSKEKAPQGCGAVDGNMSASSWKSDAQANYRRLAAVATPVKNVGISLGPEGGAHQSMPSR
jgi:hypothetical protein